MTDQDLEKIYLSARDLDQVAGLRAVYSAGYWYGKNLSLNLQNLGDVSKGAPAPTSNVVVK